MISIDWKKKRIWLLLIAVISFILFIAIPLPKTERPLSTVIVSSEGDLLGAKIAADGQWRFPGLDSIPNKLNVCIRLFEDEYFYYHPGINPISIIRAIQQNTKANKIVSGGSTITMQLARISCENPPRTYVQKFVELFYSLKFEFRYSKTEILKKYLDNAPFGGNVVGIEAASWRYFQRSPFQLSWAETATLAVLPNAPSLIYPGKAQQSLLNKRNALLQKLFERKILSEMEYELALLEPLPSKPHPLPRLATHLLEKFDRASGEKRLHSSLQKQLQIAANEIVEKHHKMLVHNQIFNAAALIVDNKSKKILAYVGNTKNEQAEHASDVDIITAPRSTGSILKPLLFAAMMTDGELLPSMLIADIPTQLHGYSPENYNLSYSGAVPAHTALSRSLNIPAVRMLQSYGVENFLDYLNKLNINDIDKSADHYGLSLILGGAEANLWDLTSAYSGMANTLANFANNSGEYDPKSWISIEYKTNKTVQLKQKKQLEKYYQIFSASAIYSTFQALLEVNRPDDELGWEQFGSSRKIAWKTGTSFGFRDAWAIGITPEYTVAVWVGNADGEGRPGLTGASSAAPILFDLFNMLPSTSWFSPPYDDMLRLPICRESGYLASQNCDHIDTTWVSKQAIKVQTCPFHSIIHLDSTLTYQVQSACYPQHAMKHKAWFILPPAWEWYYKQQNPFYRKLPPYLPNCSSKNEIAMMEFLYPSEAYKLYIPKDLDGKQTEIVFRVVHREANKKLFWHLDNFFIGSTEHFHEMGINPPTGNHRITVVDEDGNRLSKNFLITNEN